MQRPSPKPSENAKHHEKNVKMNKNHVKKGCVLQNVKMSIQNRKKNDQNAKQT